MVRAGKAVLAADMFTFNGSLAKGRKMVADLSKLMLRAYNAEADNCVRSLRSGNISTATRRLDAAMAAIEKLGAIMEMRVNPEYHALRVAELQLTWKCSAPTETMRTKIEKVMFFGNLAFAEYKKPLPAVARTVGSLKGSGRCQSLSQSSSPVWTSPLDWFRSRTTLRRILSSSIGIAPYLP
jgi:hypothetical protein